MKRRWAVCGLWDKTASTAASGSCQKSVKTAGEKFQPPSLDWRGRLDQGPTRRGGNVFACWLCQNEVPHTGLNNRNPEVLKTGSTRLRCRRGPVPLMSEGRVCHRQGGSFLAVPWLRRHHCSLYMHSPCVCLPPNFPFSKDISHIVLRVHHIPVPPHFLLN